MIRNRRLLFCAGQNVMIGSGRRRNASRRKGNTGVKNYIWDLDGTLLDSYGVITSSAADTLRDYGLAADETALLTEMKNYSLTAILKRAAEETGVPFEAVMDRYRDYTRQREDRIMLIPQARETLAGLRENGAVHYVYTHRGRSAYTILDRLGILNGFEDLLTGEDGCAPKPSGDGIRELIRRHGLDPRNTCYVGDRPMDVLCARDAGVTAVLFLPADGCVRPTGQEDLIVSGLAELICEDGRHSVC